MKHRVVGRKLGRTSAHRLALLRNLSTSLFQHERVRTTLMKAKELRPFAEKLVTLSKRETLHARRQVLRHIHDGQVVAKLFDTLSARFAQRPGGYTRIIKLGPRRGDQAEMAIIELVDYDAAARPAGDKAPEPRKRGWRRAAKGAEGAAEGTEGEAPEKQKQKQKAKPARESAKKARAKPAKKKAGGARKSGGGKSTQRTGGSRSK